MSNTETGQGVLRHRPDSPDSEWRELARVEYSVTFYSPPVGMPPPPDGSVWPITGRLPIPPQGGRLELEFQDGRRLPVVLTRSGDDGYNVKAGGHLIEPTDEPEGDT